MPLPVSHDDVADWLRANNIDPATVLDDTRITIIVNPDGTRSIQYSAIRYNEHGEPVRGDGPSMRIVTDACTVPLIVVPEHHRHPRRTTPHRPAAQVALFVRQAEQLRKLRAELERSRRRECNKACDEVGYERDRLAGELEDARVGLVTLGERVTGWADLAKQHQAFGMRYFAAWKSARRRSRARTDERDAWKALYEAGEDAERLRALTARVQELHGALRDVLGKFVHETHPGAACLQSGHVYVATVQKWRDILTARPVPTQHENQADPS